MSRAELFAAGSVAVGLVVLALKVAAWWITGSVALYSDALESVVNVAAAAGAWWALRVSARPADANHPYGHAKAEFLSAVAEGVLVVVAALSILHAAWGAFVAPVPPDAPWAGLALNGVATVLNAAWGSVMIARGRALHAPALLADGRHLMADVATSIGVFAGVAAVALTGILWLDPLCATLSAANILYSGARVIRDSVGGLMDEALEARTLERIRAIVADAAQGAIEAHDLRSRAAGRHRFLEFHLVVPAAMTVAEAHDICDRIESALRAEIAGLSVTIHVEPEGKAKHRGVLVL
jgi:cation diffusion facilitator family transporter